MIRHNISLMNFLSSLGTGRGDGGWKQIDPKCWNIKDGWMWFLFPTWFCDIFDFALDF